MKLLNHILTGLGRSARSWKLILIAWLFNFILVTLVILPFRNGMNSIFGSSMITGLLGDGINLDVFTNSGAGFQGLFAVLRSGVLLLIFTGVLLNVFFSGGFFSVLGKAQDDKPAATFFSGAAALFWSYLIITFIIWLIVLFTGLLFIGLPQLFVMGSDNESVPVTTAKVSLSVFLLVLPVIMLVADYGRAWRADNSNKGGFRAVGKGFGLTFRHFLSSYALMAIILALQLLFIVLTFIIISGFKPVSGSGIFLLFLLSQVLVIIKIALKVCRYGSVTSMFESHTF